MQILVTGGTGYIGSHTVVELLNRHYDVVILDNLSNSHQAVLPRIASLTNRQPSFVKGDIRDKLLLQNLFQQYQFDAVIHFAGLKAVGESSQIPMHYYQNNVSGSLTLFEVMAEFGVKNLVFSSSATVYGEGNVSPLTENMPTGAINPYGQTKLMIEHILADLAASDADWRIACLRYFNPIGAHESGMIGEDPNGIPNNLLPYVSQVAIGKLQQLSVFGNDYPTRDGTGVRDYIHVVDLAIGHIAAIEKLASLPGYNPINLGTGNGTSVLEIVALYQQISGREVPYKIVERRSGDLAEVFADASLALQKLGWKTEFDIKRMITDSWRWQSTNPNGYQN